MPQPDSARLGQLFYTGVSRFLVANENFVGALVQASSRCAIHASEDIVDAYGLKLWARGQAISERLLERLSSRQLRKPIELCVYARDPVAVAGIAETAQELIEASPDLRALLLPRLPALLSLLRSYTPNPTELMLWSVMRHGGRDMVDHATLVCAVALASAQILDVHPDLFKPLMRAALLHDVGLLYLPASLVSGTAPRERPQLREIHTHPDIGAQVVVELAGCGTTVAHLVAASHERLDGHGYPRGLKADDLSLPAQALLFAEAQVPLIVGSSNGLRRAAVAARLVPGEFPGALVNWVVQCGATRPVEQVDDIDADAVVLDLQQMHSLLAGVARLLAAAPARETTAVRVAAVPWQRSIDILRQELCRCGVDSALADNGEIAPQQDGELIELAVLTQELLHRIRALRIAVEMEQADSPALACSAMVIELIEALRACEPLPEGEGAAKGSRSVLMPWSNLYSVGVAAIDEQHRVLVGLLNRLNEARDAARSTAVMHEVLDALVQYAGRHFAFEEALMHEHRYAGTAAHEAAHQRLAQRVGAMIAAQENGGQVSLRDLTVFLRQWLISHILHTDKELGKALNARGVR